MNPHDASSRHDNSGYSSARAAALDLLQTERAVALLSGYALPPTGQPPRQYPVASHRSCRC
ncbi:hypothetical protein ULF88_11940 [Halopseudomonas pachastrellae]|nr:hypothetical protein [Halopseudomonas pachastrellae]